MGSWKKIVLLAGALASLVAAQPAGAEVKEVRLARQYGLGYLPLMVMEQQHLIEKQAKRAGLGDIKVSWHVLNSGAAMNDALLAGGIDYASGGVAPMITLWAKSKGNVKGVAALDTVPIFLNSNNPSVRSVKDLTAKDRIGLPASKVSIQAVALQMAAAKAFGEGQHEKLDPLTVSMKHPDAMTALLSGRSEVTGHLASPPFMFQELKDPRVHTVMNSFDVLGGPHTFDLVWTTKSFHDANPKTYAAVLAALDEAMAFINKNRRGAAELYVNANGNKESVGEVYEMITRHPVGFTATPLKVARFAEFMARIGHIATKPADWRDLFFAEVHDRKGS